MSNYRLHRLSLNVSRAFNHQPSLLTHDVNGSPSLTKVPFFSLSQINWKVQVSSWSNGQECAKKKQPTHQYNKQSRFCCNVSSKLRQRVFSHVAIFWARFTRIWVFQWIAIHSGLNVISIWIHCWTLRKAAHLRIITTCCKSSIYHATSRSLICLARICFVYISFGFVLITR